MRSPPPRAGFVPFQVRVTLREEGKGGLSKICVVRVTGWLLLTGTHGGGLKGWLLLTGIHSVCVLVEASKTDWRDLADSCPPSSPPTFPPIIIILAAPSPVEDPRTVFLQYKRKGTCNIFSCRMRVWQETRARRPTPRGGHVNNVGR